MVYCLAPSPTLLRLKSECGPTEVRLQSEKRRCTYGADAVLIQLGRARYKLM